MMQRGAIISECGTWRYLLIRHWGAGENRLLYIMLNPSTADGVQDDPTIIRCVKRAQALGYDGIYVVNLFAFRSPSPAVLLAAPRVCGPRNNAYLKFASSRCATAVAAWGTHGHHKERDHTVPAMLNRPLLCLGTTKDGKPRHPLYVKADQPLVHFWKPGEPLP